MTDSERELLLGRLLGALEEEENELLDARLATDPEYRKELVLMHRLLEPLDRRRVEFAPPPGLAQRTCQMVFEHTSRPLSLENGKKLRPQITPPSWTGRMTKLDMVMAATVLVAATMLIFPAISNSRFSARRAACQDNLRDLGGALTKYSQAKDGYFPVIPTRGKLATAGIYAPMLFQNNLITDVSRVVCPDSTLAANRNSFTIPTYKELEIAPQSKIVDLRPTLGGSYGYNLGYTRDGNYYPTKNLGRDNFAIMSDSPSDKPEHRSDNHGGMGQNVLFEGGNVRFLTSTKPDGSGDDIFANDDGQVAAGLHRNDSVIGSSQASPTPVIYVNNK
jgi:hypothetical protein